MKYFFMIPMYISPSVNAELVPGIAKMMERLIIVNYKSNILEAVKINAPSMMSDNTNTEIDVDNNYIDLFLEELSPLEKDIQDNERELNKLKRQEKILKDRLRRCEQQYPYDRQASNLCKERHTFALDRIEPMISNVEDTIQGLKNQLVRQKSLEDDPEKRMEKLDRYEKRAEEKEKRAEEKNKNKWIRRASGQSKMSGESKERFYKDVSLEPTIIEIPLSIPLDPYGEAREIVNVEVGFKSLPMALEEDQMEKLVSMVVSKSFSGSLIQRIPKYFVYYFKRRYRRVISFFMDKINKKPENIIVLPTPQELSNEKNLAKYMRRYASNSFSKLRKASWYGVSVFSKSDFEGINMNDLLYFYQNLPKFGWGGLIIVDEVSETLYFCEPKYGGCSSLSFAQLQSIYQHTRAVKFKFDDDTIARSIQQLDAPFRKVSRKQMFENCLIPQVQKYQQFLEHLEMNDLYKEFENLLNDEGGDGND